jgi:hypothetical protein
VTTITNRTLLTISVTALLTSAVTFFAAGFGTAAGSAPTQQRLRAGDYVEIPALNWTCALSWSGAYSFTCSTNNKPISNVDISGRQIVVAVPGGRAPLRIAPGGYRFRYQQG